jgi:hypothetical protein
MARQSDGRVPWQAATPVPVSSSEHTARTVDPTVLPPGAILGRNGGILRPWQPGQRGNPENKRPDDYLACQKACRERSPEAVEKVSELMRTSSDERVQYMAATWIVERAFGKAKEYDPNAAREAGASLDVATLTREELDVLLEITRRGAVRQAAPDDDASVTTVDATVTETRLA